MAAPSSPPRPRRSRKQVPDPRVTWLRGTRARIVWVTLLPLSLLLGSLAVSGYLQFERHDVFRREAERNYLRTITLDNTRGHITDRNGVLLASSVDMDTVVADPKFANAAEFAEDPETIDYPYRTAVLLAEALDLNVDDVYERVTRKKRFVYIKRRISREESRRVRAIERKGVYLVQESKRFYPKKELAGQVIGIIGLNDQPEGIERAFDTALRGESVSIPALRDTRGRISFPDALPRIPRFAGHTVVLSIDEKIQQKAEQILERAVIASRALSGVAVVYDVKTGEVLAAANVPRFNPNNYQRYAWERRRNRVVTDAFEPGSTFKVFILAAALDLGVVSLDDVMNVEGGRYKVGPYHVVRDTHPETLLPVWDVVKFSSNIGFIKLGELIGKRILYDYLTDFGFGTHPRSGLRVEASGHLQKPRDWVTVTFANICFGQGVSVSALQLTRAMAAIANGGKLMEPILVRELQDSNGNTFWRRQPRVERQVVSEEAAAQVMAALARVVEEGGTGTAAASDRFAVFGKTGTSQKPDHLIGGYSAHAWIGSFLGVAPAEDPRIAVLVSIDEPVGKGYGGLVAAPPFREIVEWTLDYLSVRPTGAAPSQTARVRSDAEALAVLNAASAHAQAERSRETRDRVAAAFAGGEQMFVPDFRGLAVRAALDLADELGIVLRVQGTGLASQQTVAAGTRVKKGTLVGLRFESAL